jgi:hypothetical protein
MSSDYLSSVYPGLDQGFDSILKELVHSICSAHGRVWQDEVHSSAEFTVRTWRTNEDGLPIEQIAVDFNLHMPWPYVYVFQLPEGPKLPMGDLQGDLSTFVAYLDNELRRLRGSYLQQVGATDLPRGSYHHSDGTSHITIRSRVPRVNARTQAVLQLYLEGRDLKEIKAALLTTTGRRWAMSTITHDIAWLRKNGLID